MFKKIIIGVILSVLIVGQFTISSFASEYYEFYINGAEPATSSTQGYVVLILRNVSTGELVPTTFFWNTILVVSNSGEESGSYCDVTLSNSGNSGSVSFAPAGNLSIPASALYTLYEIQTNGTFQLQKHSSSERFSFTWHGYNIVNYKVSGNGYIHGVNADHNYLCNVYFNTDNSANLLMELIGTLSHTNTINQSILNNVNNILNSVNDVESQLSQVIEYLRSIDGELDSIRSELQLIYQKADALLLEQKASNTWLEKIFNFLKEKDEKDKEAATQQGSSSTSQGMDAIEDKGGDFASSIGGLTNSMSYSGTQCAWEFPEVKIPAIPGVMDEVVLIRRQPIDFAQWVNAIPSDILLVVQSVCTIGLIVYCFKELYNTIAYVLTLRRDDNE